MIGLAPEIPEDLYMLIKKVLLLAHSKSAVTSQPESFADAF